MKKNFVRMAVMALVGFAMAACSTKDELGFSESNLYGYWLEDGTQHYVNFTNERQSDEYQLGYEWDEAEEVTEEDVKNNHMGNGWFKWNFTTKTGDLLEIQLMDNDGAEIPKSYVVTKLTETELVYYEKDQKSNKFSFKKIAGK